MTAVHQKYAPPSNPKLMNQIQRWGEKRDSDSISAGEG